MNHAFSLRDCVQNYDVDIQRCFERGNHDADSLDYNTLQ